MTPYQMYEKTIRQLMLAEYARITFVVRFYAKPEIFLSQF